MVERSLTPARPPTSQQQYGPQLQGPGGAQRPFFQYSQCTGARKALLVSFPYSISVGCSMADPKIGINYVGQSGELRGCINDAHNVQKFLIGLSIAIPPRRLLTSRPLPLPTGGYRHAL